MAQYTPSVLITGASSGIGYSTAALFRDRGWEVFGLSRSGKAPQGVRVLLADVNDPSQLKSALADLRTKTTHLDAVINAAGIGGTGVVECFPLAEAKQIMDTNFYGTLNMIQLTMPMLRESGGTFIAVSSIAGLIGVPFHGLYSASKFAVEGLIESLRLELKGSRAQAVSICPGDTNTPILGRQYRTPLAEVPNFYQQNYHAADEAMRESVEHGYSPERVAVAIFKVVQNRSPITRYPVGDFLQKISPVVKRVMPSRLFEFMMTKYYGLQ